jgi:hypothetical protein
MSPPPLQPDDSHALRSLLASARKSPGTTDHAQLLAMFPSDAAMGQQVGVPVRGGPRPPVMPCGPNTTLMTTAAAARYLGLAGCDSARIWLAQRGIRPVGREPGPSGQNLYPAQAVLPLHGQRRRRPPAYDPWRDGAGVSIPLGARVEQVLADRAHGALASRLGKQAQVLRRSRSSRLVVRFDGETQPVSIRPDLVRLRPVTTEHIIGQLEQLRDLVGDGDGR